MRARAWVSSDRPGVPMIMRRAQGRVAMSARSSWLPCSGSQGLGMKELPLTATHWKIVVPTPSLSHWRRTSTLDVHVCQNMDAARGAGTEVEGTEVRVCMRASFG